jgi:hypothetical protein
VRAAVLWCAVARADGGGGLWWPEPMMDATCMHLWAPRRAVVPIIGVTNSNLNSNM